MGYFSDPTAAAAMGELNREFSRLEKKARALRKRWEKGEISDRQLELAQAQFKGIYRHVLTHVLKEERKK